MRTLALFLGITLLLPLVAATRRKPARSASSKKSSTGKKSSSKSKSAKGKKGRSRAQSWRSRQLSPTPDRYRQVQEALANKGYLQSTPNGVWDQSSVEALRRFQQEQKLNATGKLDSLSLIALGLGPKYAIPASAAPAKPNQP